MSCFLGLQPSELESIRPNSWSVGTDRVDPVRAPQRVRAKERLTWVSALPTDQWAAVGRRSRAGAGSAVRGMIGRTFMARSRVRRWIWRKANT